MHSRHSCFAQCVRPMRIVVFVLVLEHENEPADELALLSYVLLTEPSQIFERIVIAARPNLGRPPPFRVSSGGGEEEAMRSPFTTMADVAIAAGLSSRPHVTPNHPVLFQSFRLGQPRLHRTH